MFAKLREAVVSWLGPFKRDERGVALTEYMVLLGVLVTGVVLAITTFGGNLDAAWDEWASWMRSVADNVRQVEPSN